MAKLTENPFRDVNIAFANELSMICERLVVDVWQVRVLANKLPRVSILEPGAGVGGHCVAVDPWFIVSAAPDEARLIRAARSVNDDKPGRIAACVTALADRFKNAVVACYGLTYRPEINDLRESPALEIVEGLAKVEGLSVLVCEPALTELPPSLRPHRNVQPAYARRAQCESDIVVFLVGHRPFRRLDPNQFLNKVVVDAIDLISRPT